MLASALALFGIIATAPHSQPFTMLCRSWACVERQIALAHQSPNISRLRVFQGEAPGVLMSGETVPPPLLDLRFQ
jgi:hypothetical protein